MKIFRNEEFAVLREKVYQTLFGVPKHVWHEKTPLVPHIDICRYTPGHTGRAFYTLVTSGMSDLVMNVPPEIGYQCGRAELVFYCSEPRTEHAELLRRLAHFPFDNKTWLGPGHTMETTAVSLLGSKALDYILFLPAAVSPDKSLPKELQIEGVPVNLLWVLPISSAELRLMQTEGLGVLLDLFSRQDHPLVFQPDRGSYV